MAPYMRLVVIRRNDGLHEWRIMLGEELVASGAKRKKSDAERLGREAIKEQYADGPPSVQYASQKSVYKEGWKSVKWRQSCQ